MKYKFKVYEEGKDIEDKEAMSFKKLLKSLVTPNPKWTGWIAYQNKKGISFFTKDDANQQIGFMHHPKNYIISKTTRT